MSLPNWKSLITQVDDAVSSVLNKWDSRAEIREVGDEFEITIGLPGYAKEDVKVSYKKEKEVLSVIANNDGRGKHEHLIRLGPEFNVTTLKAKMYCGLLTMTMGKNPISAKVREINID